MLHDVVVHLHNEQPILVDLVEEPTAVDVALICTNVRTMSGTVPVFVDRRDSTFLFPLAAIRFVEIHRDRSDTDDADDAADEPSDRSGQAAAEAVRPARRLGPGSGSGAPSGKATKGGDRHDSAADEVEGRRNANDIEPYPETPLGRLSWLDGDAEAESPSGDRPGGYPGPDAGNFDEKELLRRVREV
jgi:hypothetical protein